MNRRNFFGTVGAAIAGAALWRKSEPVASFTLVDNSSPLHATVFVADEVHTREGGIYLGMDGEWHGWDHDHPPVGAMPGKEMIIQMLPYLNLQIA